MAPRKRANTGRRKKRLSRARRVGLWLARLVCLALIAPVAYAAAGAWLAEAPYWIDIGSHFAVHTLAVAVVLLVAAVAAGARWTAVPAAGATAVLAVLTVGAYRPLAIGGDEPPEGGKVLRVVVYNAFARGAERTGSDLDARFARWVRERRADVVFIIDPPWRIDGSGLWPGDVLPYAIDRTDGRENSATVLSRYPIRVERLVERRTRENRLSMPGHGSVVLTLPEGREILLCPMHPRSPRTERDWAIALRLTRTDAQILNDAMATRDMPVIVGGDFNSAPTGRLHRMFARQTGLRSPTPLVGAGTYPARLHPWLSLPIDKVWVQEATRVLRCEVGPRVYSDHRPILYEVALPAQNGQ